MQRNLTQMITRAVGLALTAMLLSACMYEDRSNPVTNHIVDTLNTARWKQNVPPPKVTAETIVVKHRVAFADGSSALSQAERNKLANFVRQVQQGDTDRVELLTPGEAKDGSLAAARVRALSTEMARYGFPPTVTNRGQGNGDSVTVAVTQVVVIVPDCTPPTPPRGERPDMSMGCANAANLAHMIANPRDLDRGRDVGPADGEALALGNERYRTGKIKNLVRESTRKSK